VNICPKCGRRYPSTMKNCLECGTRLADREQEPQKRDIQRVAKQLAIVAGIGIILCAIWFVVLPLLNYSMVSGHNFSATVRAGATDQAAGLPRYSLNQPARNSELEVIVTRTREGSNVLNANRLYYVTVALRNLKPQGRVLVSGSDFILGDAAGNTYYTYAIGDRVAQEIGPLETKSYELNYEIPRDTRAPDLQFWFPKTASGTVSGTPVIFSLTPAA
jgi:hypothetical protein